MKSSVISVSNISKRYRLGLDQKEETFVGQLKSLITYPIRNLKRISSLSSFNDNNQDPTVFWALSGINFEVRQGEVLGLIGSNGAGKSTLLKILSRITEPTTGEIIIKGRVSSLLEVGTGFHPELTGRDNVYMNGTILGMTKTEIDRKFDEIVDFSGIEKHLDTPVKFYSSGMKVRLAFSVAAHLEPEILLIDEVLAVGDIQFQRKCLGKMDEIRGQGRTVLFVSHNMAAIQGLCSRCLLLSNGEVEFDGDVMSGIQLYRTKHFTTYDADLNSREDREGNGEFKFLKVEFNGGKPVIPGKPLIIGLTGSAKRDVDNLTLAIKICYESEGPLMVIDSKSQGVSLQIPKGIVDIQIELPTNYLIPNTYRIGLWSAIGKDLADKIDNSAEMVVHPEDLYGSGNSFGPKHGFFFPMKCTWISKQAEY